VTGSPRTLSRPLATRRADVARRTLAAVRIFNGTVALVAPSLLVRRLGAEPEASPAATYAFRLFGIRTVLIGADLLSGEVATRDLAVRRAPFIHATDTVTAAALAYQRRLPRRAAVLITSMSAMNVALALAAKRRAGRLLS
jgi:hypothetical protein